MKADATPLPERALTTADIASQFAAKAKVQAVASDVDERGEFAELASSGRRGSRHDDPHEEQRHLVEFMTLSDAQRGAQFAELAERVAELERQRLALLAEVDAAIESMTLAGAADRLHGADPETVDRALADLLSRLVRMLAPDIEAAAQARGRPLNEAEHTLLAGPQEPEWRALAELLSRLHTTRPANYSGG